MQSQADRIIAKFGTQTKLAEALGCRQSVISGWKLRGFIPASRHNEVVEAGRKCGIEISGADFLGIQSSGIVDAVAAGVERRLKRGRAA